jgi:hypothetical protein
MSIMIWVGISMDGTSDLVECKRSSKRGFKAADFFEQVLIPHIKPWFQDLKDKGKHPILMMDGAPIHTAKIVVEWLKSENIDALP